MATSPVAHPMTVRHVRICRWCHRPFHLGTRRYWTDYCCPLHRMLDTEKSTTTTIVMAGGNGETIMVEAQVRDWPTPAMTMNGGARHE